MEFWIGATLESQNVSNFLGKDAVVSGDVGAFVCMRVSVCVK